MTPRSLPSFHRFTCGTNLFVHLFRNRVLLRTHILYTHVETSFLITDVFASHHSKKYLTTDVSGVFRAKKCLHTDVFRVFRAKKCLHTGVFRVFRAKKCFNTDVFRVFCARKCLHTGVFGVSFLPMPERPDAWLIVSFVLICMPNGCMRIAFLLPDRPKKRKKSCRMSLHRLPARTLYRNSAGKQPERSIGSIGEILPPARLRCRHSNSISSIQPDPVNHGPGIQPQHLTLTVLVAVQPALAEPPACPLPATRNSSSSNRINRTPMRGLAAPP